MEEEENDGGPDSPFCHVHSTGAINNDNDSAIEGVEKMDADSTDALTNGSSKCWTSIVDHEANIVAISFVQ